MPTYTLSRTDPPLQVETFDLTEADIPGSPRAPANGGWSVRKRTLRGGRSAGVDLITLDNGALSVDIIPTRGLGLWRGAYRGQRLGWSSPVRDGPVHPAFVRLDERGGLGWLDGFDELMVRCGLAHNGAPFETADPVDPDPAAPPPRRTMHPLHGRIANIPASHVAVQVDDDAGGGRTIAVEGRVIESALFHPQFELATRIATAPGSNRLTIRDAICNRSDRPGAFQLLYHWNFGPPYLGPGATFHAPIATLVPRNPRAAEGIAAYATYDGPTPGFAEQVYLAHLVGAGPAGETLAMLVAPERTLAVVLRFRRSELPCFSLWKATGGLADGYVTGLEPGTNFPHPRPYEAARGRVVPLEPGATHVAETTLELLDTPGGIAAALDEIAALQRTHPATIHPRPTEPFAPPG